MSKPSRCVMHSWFFEVQAPLVMYLLCLLVQRTAAELAALDLPVLRATIARLANAHACAHGAPGLCQAAGAPTFARTLC